MQNNTSEFVSGEGTSTDPCEFNYPGPGAFSEKEVRAVANFVSVNDVVLYMAYHNCGQFYTTPYGYTFDEPPDYDELVRKSLSTFVSIFTHCGKVMFLHLSVSHSVHEGGGGRA